MKEGRREEVGDDVRKGKSRERGRAWEKEHNRKGKMNRGKKKDRRKREEEKRVEGNREERKEKIESRRT